MLESLLETTLKRKNEIHNYFDSIQSKISNEKVEKTFNYHDFTKNKQDKTFAAIDGSFNKKKFMACFIYAVGSQTIISKPQESLIKESSTSDINTVTSLQSRNIDSILSKHMNILELKSTIDTLQRYPEIDYMLMDGSIRGTLRNFPTNFNLPQEVFGPLRLISNNIGKELEKGSFPLEISTMSKKEEIKYEVTNMLKDSSTDYEDIETEVLRYMESLEQLECIHVLLKHFKDKIVCISKTSSTHNIYNERIPDSAVLEYIISKSGYTNMDIVTNELLRHTSDKGLVPIKYPIHGTAFSDYEYTVFFTKLSDRTNVLKIEIPYKIIDKNKIEEILEDLYSSSIDGYPFILAKAHNEVVIKQKDMNNIINRLEIFEKTGRDMLEH